jgi:hypothetical protein
MVALHAREGNCVPSQAKGQEACSQVLLYHCHVSGYRLQVS